MARKKSKTKIMAAATAAAAKVSEGVSNKGEQSQKDDQQSVVTEKGNQKDGSTPTVVADAAASSSAKKPSSLFVRNLPFDATNEDLEAFFSDIGPVRQCFVVGESSAESSEASKDATKKNKGFGFVHFAIADDAQRALNQLKNVKFKGIRPLLMEFSLPRKKQGERGAASSSTEKQQQKPLKIKGPKPTAPVTLKNDSKKSRLVIRNLPFTCTEADIRAAFTPFGKIVELSLPTKPQPEGKSTATPLCRGFAFIQMSTLAESEAALEGVNGSKIKIRAVAVDWAMPKKHYDESQAEVGAESESKSAETGSHKESKKVESKVHDGDDEGDDGEDDEENVGLVEVGDEDDEADDGGNNDQDEDDDDAESVDVIYEGEDESESKSNGLQVDLSEGSTLFIRNLSFDTLEEALHEKFTEFGPLRYARITKDVTTGRSRGTGFVCFMKTADVDSCLAAYATAVKSYELLDASTKDESKGDEKEGKLSDASNTKKERQRVKRTEAAAKSILVPEPSITSSAVTPFMLDGRFLNVTRAVSRKEATSLAEEGRTKRRASDRRNMYLIREGVIFPETEAAAGLPPAELAKRQKAYSERKRLLDSNPNLFISKVKLSARNLDARTDQMLLKRMGVLAVKRFWEEVQKRTRKGLEKEVIDEEIERGRQVPGTTRKIIIKKAQIMLDMDKKDATTNKPKSKGFGFIEFESHADALACLRWLNNNPFAFTDGKPTSLEELNALKKQGLTMSAPASNRRRPIVEFAIENRLVLKKKEERAQAQKEKAAAAKDPQNNTEQVNGAEGNKTQPKSKKRKADSDIQDGKKSLTESFKASKKQKKQAKQPFAKETITAASNTSSKRKQPESDGPQPTPKKEKKAKLVTKAQQRDIEDDNKFMALLGKYNKGLFGPK